MGSSGIDPEKAVDCLNGNTMRAAYGYNHNPNRLSIVGVPTQFGESKLVLPVQNISSYRKVTFFQEHPVELKQ